MVGAYLKGELSNSIRLEVNQSFPNDVLLPWIGGDGEVAARVSTRGVAGDLLVWVLERRVHSGEADTECVCLVILD